MEDDTIRAYDAIHELYDAETIDFWENFPREIIERFVCGLPGKELLNLGSGPGRDALILRESGLIVTCVDGSEKMVETTRKMGFHSIMSDIRHLQFENDSFHGVWAYSSIIHLTFKDAAILVNNIYSILKPGGLMFLGLIQGRGNEIRKVGESDEFVRYFEYYDAHKITRLIGESGFIPVSLDEYTPRNHTYLNCVFRKD